MKWRDLATLLLAVLLTLAILLGGGLALIRFVVARFTALPPRPSFPNDTSTPSPAAAAPSPAKPQSALVPSPAASSPSPVLEPGQYRARVAEPIGLILRDSPTQDAERLGGIAYDETVVVLEAADNGRWERVRQESTGREGWVSGGNLEKLP